MDPFADRDDIVSVQPLTESVPTGRVQVVRTVGAVITLRALPGMTSQWLQRVIDCEFARCAALGHDVPGYCPLVAKHVTTWVNPARTGFTVAVRADSSDMAPEILRCAQALVAH